MIAELQKLRRNEIIVLKEMIKKYLKYDKLDLLLHKTLKSLGISKEEFDSRETIEKPKKTNIIIQQQSDDLNSFCDGDRCEIHFPMNKC